MIERKGMSHLKQKENMIPHLISLQGWLIWYGVPKNIFLIFDLSLDIIQ